MDSTVLYKLSYGLYAIGVMDGDIPQGCIVNTVFQVSSDHMIALSMSKNNYTHDLIVKNKRFCATVLTEDTPSLTIGRLGFFTGAKVHKFENLHYEMIDGLPVLQDNCGGYLICEVSGSFDAGSHTVFFAKVVNAGHSCASPVMTYEYYRSVVKGKAPKNAPTYQG